MGGGIASRRIGSARVAFAQLSLPGLCCLASPLAFLLPHPAYLGFLVAWGVFVVGDSPQFSALTAATAPRAFVGSALTIVNCIGFALTRLPQAGGRARVRRGYEPAVSMCDCR